MAEIGGEVPLILGVMWTLTGLTTLIVAARLFIRSRVLRNIGLDDWLIVVSMITGLLYVIFTTVSVGYGYGQHASTLSKESLTAALLWTYISFIFGILSFAFPKLAVAALLNRLLNPGKWQRIWLWGLTILVAIVACINVIMLYTMCDPPEAMWKTYLVLEGKAVCKSPWLLVHYATFNGVLSGFADLYLAIYPSFVLFKLQMSTRKKLALSATLGFGAIACAIAVIKCVQLKGLADQTDPTIGTVPLVIWTNVEANMVVIASCIPTLQPLLELLMGKRKLSSFARSNRYQRSTTRADRSKQSNLSSSRKNVEVDSQESILQTVNADDANEYVSYQIRRTDDVMIEYEMEPQGRV